MGLLYIKSTDQFECPSKQIQYGQIWFGKRKLCPHEVEYTGYIFFVGMSSGNSASYRVDM